MGLTLPSDLFPQDVVASVTGLSGLGASGVSALSTLGVGLLVDKFSYLPAFIAAGTIPFDTSNRNTSKPNHFPSARYTFVA